MDAFSGPNNNGYSPGISAIRTTMNERAALAIGAYKNNSYDSGYTFDIGSNNYTYGGRTTWTPYYDEPSNGRYMLHLGFGSEFRHFNTQLSAFQAGTNVRIRSRGELRSTSSTLDPNFADTGNFFANDQTLFCPELALQWGSLLIQAEYQKVYMHGAAATKGGARLGNVNFQGGYVQALYFLTGEHRPYSHLEGIFNRVEPYENAFFTRGARRFGRGAWQVGVRLDWLDLNSGAVKGGNEQDMTLGLNWFLNPNSRFQFNYVISWVNNSVATTFPGPLGSLNGARFTGDGTIHMLGARMDFNF